MALPAQLGTRERDKFVENAAAEVCVRVVATDAAGADITVADDAAFTPATSVVTPIGFFADETSTDSVNEGDTGAARMTLDRRQIVADNILDDAALGVGTSYISVIGGFADETAPDSVHEGDVGALRMTLNRRLITADLLLDDAAMGVGTDYVSVMGGFADESSTDSVNEGDVGALRMTLDRRLITAGQILDDAAFGIGTSYVSTVGYLVDDTATDSVDEGDVGAARMSADRLLYVQGALAHSAVDAGNPIKIGGIAKSAQIAAVTASDRTDAVFNLYGELVIAGYTWGTVSNRSEEIDPMDEHYVEAELIDTTNVAAATNYYPSSSGQVMGNYNNVSIHGVTSGGVTFTVEAKIDDSTDWVDITPAGYRLDDNTSGNASLIDQTFMMDFDDLRVRNVRIKSVTADATNGVQYHWRLSAI